MIQRYNAVLLHDCFVKEEEKIHSSLIFVLFCIAQRIFFIPWELSTGVKIIIIIIMRETSYLFQRATALQLRAFARHSAS